jgi:hypothetical protein
MGILRRIVDDFLAGSGESVCFFTVARLGGVVNPARISIVTMRRPGCNTSHAAMANRAAAHDSGSQRNGLRSITMELTVSGAGSSGGGGRNRLGPTKPWSSVVANIRTLPGVCHCENGTTKRGEK